MLCATHQGKAGGSSSAAATSMAAAHPTHSSACQPESFDEMAKHNCLTYARQSPCVRPTQRQNTQFGKRSRNSWSSSSLGLPVTRHQAQCLGSLKTSCTQNGSERQQKTFIDDSKRLEPHQYWYTCESMRRSRWRIAVPQQHVVSMRKHVKHALKMPSSRISGCDHMQQPRQTSRLILQAQGEPVLPHLSFNPQLQATTIRNAS